MSKFSAVLLASLCLSLPGSIYAQVDSAAINQSNVLVVQSAETTVTMLALNDTAAGKELISNPLPGEKIVEDEGAPITNEIGAFEIKLDSIMVATKQMVRRMLTDSKGTLSKTSTIEISLSYKNRVKAIENPEKIFVNSKGDAATPIKGSFEQGSNSWSINGLVVAGYQKLTITPKAWNPPPHLWEECYNCQPKAEKKQDSTKVK